ncbi:rRNA maturation RNase YbeY [Aquimarina intermedia]|uniref:Endoribonuclease YbeY n=1 Tax=Aquimarina intermedia TaxID=350814 RepID=A0A5S5CEG8_9FLAO|nr:rRNA maturation RNase YbeY [Aquimarina intermedia]TYP76902.1 rRNA maturation RNase YbeY [Aquimarina intermedia]
MISFYYEENTQKLKEQPLINWLKNVAVTEKKTIDEITYIICDDEYLLDINKKFLDHDTYTDIITFDNSIGKILSADIFISQERVIENAIIFGCSVEEEMRRVLVHGVLHLCGYTDKTDDEQALMTAKENEKLALFHVEQ